jgi:putative ABC transport system permease protein
MIYSLKVASRYLTSNPGQTGLLIVGVAVGVYVFVFMSALIGGLAVLLLDRTVGNIAHVTVEESDRAPVSLFPDGDGTLIAFLRSSAQRLLAEKGTGSFGSNQDDAIFLPLHTVQNRIQGNDNVTVIYIAAQSESVINQVQQDLTSLMRQRRHLSVNEDDDFMVMDMRQISSMLGSVMGVLTGLLAAIAGISLLVGGIGIMNIMLVSVTERTREIGIRLAIGARESQVLSQFLIEAIALSTLGGVAGIILGLLVSFVATRTLGVPFIVDWNSVFLAFGFSAFVGVAFGYFPARGAARLDPIQALRHE